jgi:DNA-binding transcriptional ArsR family regulator
MDKPAPRRIAIPQPQPDLAQLAAEFERDRYFLNLERLSHEKQTKTNSTERLTNLALPRILNHMVEHPKLDATFHALSDPTRRGMLARLARGETSIGDLAEPFAMSFAGASKHIRVLETAGLVARRKVGRSYMCALKPAPLAEAEAWLRQWERFWTTRLDALEALILADQQKEP